MEAFALLQLRALTREREREQKKKARDMKRGGALHICLPCCDDMLSTLETICEDSLEMLRASQSDVGSPHTYHN